MIKGDKIVLDDFDQVSWGAFYMWMKDEDFMNAVQEDVFPVSLQDINKIFSGFSYPSGRLFSIKAILKGDDDFTPVGYIGLRGIDNHQRRAEIHFGLGDSRARQMKSGGLGIEALELVNNYASDSLGLHTLYSIMRSDNQMAINSAKTAGYKMTTIKDFFWKNGKFINGTFAYINM